MALGRFISFTEGLGNKRCCEDLGRKASGHSVSLLGVHELIVILLPLLFSKLLNTLTMLVNAQLYINSPRRLERHSEHTAFSETLKCLYQEKKLRIKHCSSLPFPFYLFLLFKALTAGTGAWRERVTKRV